MTLTVSTTTSTTARPSNNSRSALRHGFTNCFLHGIEDFRIERGDTLAEPKFVQGDRLMQFDVILANPPYSIKQWDRSAFAADPWGRNCFGTPPQGRADYAFWQHILSSLNSPSPVAGRGAGVRAKLAAAPSCSRTACYSAKKKPTCGAS